MDAATLGFGATFSSLATREGLIALDKHFLAQAAAQDPALHESLLAARAAPDTLEAKAESHLMTSLGPILDAFIAELFGIEDALDEVVAQTKHLDPIHACKRLFVQRQAVKKYADPSGFNGAALRAELEQMARPRNAVANSSISSNCSLGHQETFREVLGGSIR